MDHIPVAFRSGNTYIDHLARPMSCSTVHSPRVWRSCGRYKYCSSSCWEMRAQPLLADYKPHQGNLRGQTPSGEPERPAGSAVMWQVDWAHKKASLDQQMSDNIFGCQQNSCFRFCLCIFVARIITGVMFRCFFA